MQPYTLILYYHVYTIFVVPFSVHICSAWTHVKGRHKFSLGSNWTHKMHFVPLGAYAHDFHHTMSVSHRRTKAVHGPPKIAELAQCHRMPHSAQYPWHGHFILKKENEVCLEYGWCVYTSKTYARYVLKVSTWIVRGKKKHLRTPYPSAW